MRTTVLSAHSRRISIAAVAVSALVISAGCSTEREDSSGGSAGAGEKCLNSEKANAEYQKAWTTASKQLGIDSLEPTDEEVCEVDTSDYAADPKQGDTYRIAFAAQGPTNSWGLTSEEAFKYHADELGVETLYASANGDANAQVDNVQQLTSQDPDAMVVVPMGEGITGQVKAAAAQDIPVVVCSGILPDDSGAVSTVTRQYDLLGSMYAEWLVDKIGGKGKVAMLSGLAGVPTAEYQAAAAEKVFEKYPDVEVVTKQYTKWSPSVAKNVAANLVSKYPDLDGIWSDSGYGDLGVVQAYEEADKPVPPLTGDASNAFLKEVKGSDVEFALSSFPPEQSMDCLDTAMDILKGKPVLNKVYIDSPSFTNREAGEYVREECSDNLLIPSTLPDPLLEKLKLC
ncbi:substrate-binding domain-containing protein [Nocardioidaceae bacterium SCSIO 66511]|nr:substrate-binding domain-containing protein [Nocardioidaceae bacterium SCSIO 66511]